MRRSDSTSADAAERSDRGVVLTAPPRITDRAGSIEAGKRANLAVLNQDPLKVAADEIQHTDPDIVIFEGHVIKGAIDLN